MSEEENKQPVFKKPLLSGKTKAKKSNSTKEKSEDIEEDIQKEITEVDSKEPCGERNEIEEDSKKLSQKYKEQPPLQYVEPVWSRLPETEEKPYYLEVLKSGSIIETINLMNKNYFTFGRWVTCDHVMNHPTISRYHAVLQYRKDSNSNGFYLYDLNSTHGTFLNKNKIKPKVYVKVQVGHMIKFGTSTRTYILCGPEGDKEAESELSVTELKKLRNDQLNAKIEEERKKEESGIDWGMGEDAEDETDLSENPFAQTTNENLFIDDPKKALRGFMEREGFDLEYDCTEQGMGQFLCRVSLPVDDDKGRPIVAEVFHKGKKKEAVVQCALEACRILDRHGLLRQATHESKKRKERNWEENDYYDSDDDTYLDRTGSIEQKREKRMKSKQPQQAETYQTLCDKEKSLSQQIEELEQKLKEATQKIESSKDSKEDEDSLDNFMKELKQTSVDKSMISKLKSDLSKLKIDHKNIIKLVNIAKPVDLPPLQPQYEVKNTKSVSILPKNAIFGKRFKVKVQKPEKKDTQNCNDSDEEREENMTTDFKHEEKNKKDECNYENEVTKFNQINNLKINQKDIENNTFFINQVNPAIKNETNQINKINEEHPKINIEKIKASFEEKNPEFCEFFSNLLYKSENFIDLTQNISGEILEYFDEFPFSKKLKVDDAEINEKETFLKHNVKLCIDECFRFRSYIDFIKTFLVGDCKKIQDISKSVIKDEETNSEGAQSDEQKKVVAENNEMFEINEIGLNQKEQDRKKKELQRKLDRKQKYAEIEKRKGYEEDSQKEDYNMWVPPEGQTGDGRTKLNDKLGY